MSFRDKIINNTPRVELHSIWSLIVGGYKTGKTRLWKEVTELHYDKPEEALLLAFEPGYETWELEEFIPLHKEAKSDDEAWRIWDVFIKEVVPGLLEEAKNNRVVKLIGVDTADRAIDACYSWLLREQSRKYGKQFSSLQEISTATKGDINGWTLLFDELKKPFDTLRNAGYGIMALAWTKEKETTLFNGLKYNSIQLMMHNTGRKVFESQASLVCCLYNEIEVLDKDGNEMEENMKNKQGKDKGTNFHDSRVVMYFRPSQYIEIAGGRYTDLPEKVDYSAENFLQVFENAVKGQLKKTKKSVSEIQKEESKQRDKESKEYAENATGKVSNDTSETPETLKDQIRGILEKKSEAEKKEIGNKIKADKEIGTVKIYSLEDVEKLNKVIEIIKSN